MMPPHNLHREHAELLLRKAAEDEALLDEVIDSSNISDEVFGFHCQQAAEKLIKAVLAIHQIIYRRTHDLDELMMLIANHQLLVPLVARQLAYFTAFAVEYRYDVWPDTAPKLNRIDARAIIRQLREWAECEIRLTS